MGDGNDKCQGEEEGKDRRGQKRRNEGVEAGKSAGVTDAVFFFSTVL